MKQIIILLTLVALTTLGTLASNKEIPLVIQILEEERSSIPDNTISLDCKQLRFSKNADAILVKQLSSLLQNLCDVDENYYVYDLLLTQTDATQVEVRIEGDHYLKGPELGWKYFGTLVIGGRHFLVRRDERETRDNMPLLKSLFNKGKEKLTYVQEYEVVEYKTVPPQTQLRAILGDDGIKITDFLANHENQLLKEQEDGREE